MKKFGANEYVNLYLLSVAHLIREIYQLSPNDILAELLKLFIFKQFMGTRGAVCSFTGLHSLSLAWPKYM